MKAWVRLSMLLETSGRASEFMDSIWDWDDTDRTFALIENWISEYPLIVEVDHEVWRSVEKHSRDKLVLIVTLSDATLTDDVLESLADDDDHVDAAVWVIRNNQWTIELRTIVD